ncbi:hypothetical protein TanjilG_23119 [Lupinus angustifolius]|uniref:Uncharacterized protein n=1 Tax=Lupinus angustifolius TaxID=3871 RepID=A0A1J7FZ14_LUPAN|nr:PREDICTED: uncharacterized protein LOC109332660 [Lupinus angustifolius]OIV93278.1 hypothetical protein TanjilG_23119 [Lupinus angustifolius]
MDPRISFSYDFVDAQQALKHQNIYSEAPVSSNFEFSVKNNGMISADEVFFQGMMVPLKTNCSKKMTLRDELLNNDDDLPRLPKSSSRWKERLGFRKGASKKDKNKNDDEFVQSPTFQQGDTTVSKKDNMELFYEGGVSCRGIK